MRVKIFIIISAAMILGCSSPSGGPCMSNGGEQEGSNYLKTIFTSDSSAKWIGADTMQNGTFTNSNGFVMLYTSGGIQKSESQVEVNKYNVPGNCGYDNYIIDYVNVEQKTHRFNASNLNFFYSYMRTAVYFNDTTKAILNTDQFSININNKVFDLPFNNNQVSRWEKLDTLTLNNNLYHDVYRVYADTPFYNPNIILPAGIYYSQQNGLIGFYFSNGELWLK